MALLFWTLFCVFAYLGALALHVGLQAQRFALKPPLPPRECFDTDAEFDEYAARWFEDFRK